MNEYVQQIETYHDELPSSGWADHELIKAAGIMEYTPTVGEMRLAFARKKEATCRKQEKLWNKVAARQSVWKSTP